MVMPFFLILEYAEDLCMNILRRKGYRTQKNNKQLHQTTRSLTQKGRKKKKNKLAKDCKHQTASTNKLTNAGPKGEEM